MKKILIVEDEVLIAEELKSMLKKLDYEVIGVIHNGDKVTDRLKIEKVDMVLLDINIKGTQDGIEVAHHLNTMEIPFVFITSYSDSDTISRVKKSKTHGYLVKPFNIDEIRVLLEMAFFRTELKNQKNFPYFKDVNNKISIPFTESEYQISRDIFDGLSNQQISSKNYISINTVKSHIRNIYSKTKVHSRTELIRTLLRIQN